MRNSSRVLSASVLAALFLLLWTARRARVPDRGQVPATVAPASSGPLVASLPPQPPPAPAPADGKPPASASADRLELERRCLHLAETDPLAAMELAIAQKLTADDPGLLNALILRWAGQDFSGAIEWARAQPHDAARDDILARLAYLHSARNPAAAAEIAANEIAGPRARAEAILSVVHQWAGQNASAALAWSARLADEDLRRRVLDDIAAVQAQKQPSA